MKVYRECAEMALCVEIKNFFRKDFNRPYGARNLYRVCKQTEKAVLLNPVDYGHGDPNFTFWCPKSAITEIHSNRYCDGLRCDVEIENNMYIVVKK